MPDNRRNAFLKIFGRRPRRTPPPAFEQEATTTLIESCVALTPEATAKDLEVSGDSWGTEFPGGLPAIDVDTRLADVKRRFHSDRDYKKVLKRCNEVYTLAAGSPTAEDLLSLTRTVFTELRKYVVGLEKRNRKSSTDQRSTKLEVCAEQQENLEKILNSVESKIQDSITASAPAAVTMVDQIVDDVSPAGTAKRKELFVAVGKGKVSGAPAEHAMSRFGEIANGMRSIHEVSDAVKTVVNECMAGGPADESRLETFCEQALIADIRGCTNPGTILRSNSAGSKLAKQYCCATKTGKAFMSDTAKGTIDSIRSLSSTPELDPLKITAANSTITQEELTQQLEENATVVRGLVERIIADTAASEVPPELARLCASIYDTTIDQFGDNDASRHAAMNAVAGTIVLRMLSPRIVCSRNFDSSQTFTPEQLRTATLVTKVYQNIANGVQSGTGKKEKFLLPFADMTDGDAGTQLTAFFERAIREGREHRDGVTTLLDPHSQVKTGKYKNKGYARRVKEPLEAAHDALERMNRGAVLSSEDTDAILNLQVQLISAESHYRQSQQDKGETAERSKKLEEIRELREALDRLVLPKATAEMRRLIAVGDFSDNAARERQKRAIHMVLASGGESIVNGILIDEISREAPNQPASDYFRGNSEAMLLMQSIGTFGDVDDYVHAATDAAIEEVSSSVFCMDPRKPTGGKTAEECVDILSGLVRKIFATLDPATLPDGLIKQSYMLYQCYLSNYGDATAAKEKIVSHLAIRFITPSMTNVMAGLDSDQRASMIILSKVVQNAANGVEFGTKEIGMTVLNPIIRETQPRVTALADEVIRKGALLLPDFDGSPPALVAPLVATVPPVAVAVEDTDTDEEEDETDGFDMGKLGELWRTLDARIRSSDRTGAQSLATAVQKFDRFLKQCPSEEAVGILREKLTRPLVLAIQAK